jgi:hypothetical protein
MVWAMLSTTVPHLAILDVDISRTRELFTVYLLVGLAFAGSWWRGSERGAATLVGVFGVFAVIGTATWTISYSWSMALNFWSEWLTAAAMLMFGMSFARSQARTWSVIILAYAGLVAGAQLLLLVFGLPARLAQTGGGPEFYGYRPLPASVALFLVLAFILAIFGEHPSGRRRTWVASGLGISVVLSQNRSAWVALLVVLFGCLVVFVRRADVRDRWPGVGVTALFFASALVVPMASGLSLLPGGASQTQRGLPESATSVGTSRWRLQMWESRMETPRSTIEWLTGGVFGPTPVKGPGSTVMNAFISGHNVVIDVLTMLGFIGVVVVAVLWLMGAVLTRDRLAPLPIFLWGLMAYGMFYNWPGWSWAVLAAALAIRDPRSGVEQGASGSTKVATGGG